MIPYGRQSISADDIEAVVKVLQGDWLTQGPAIDRFEELIAAKTEARYCVAFANGTAALHAAAAAAGLGPGDTVATTPLTFAASGACARYVGADLTLIDIDPDTLCIDLEKMPPGLDAIVPMHYGGLPVDLEAMPYRPRVVIEDAAHAIGARTADGPVGNCAHSDMTIFSFHPVKTITSAEGGAVTTNDTDLADAMRTFRHHGVQRRPEEGAWYYEIPEVGYNYRITDMQAALGESQLHRLDQFIARRNEIAARYRAELADLPLTLPREPDSPVVHGRHLFPIQVDERRRVHEELKALGVGTQVHYVPLYRHRAYVGAAVTPEQFPHCEAAYQRLLSLPMFPDLTEAEQGRVVAALETVLR
ncbi:MAG: UDP-4-amino-4,6-dideoxy-N-acetyl-beta-L-altrosamine transaminase [Acidimicrobiales bacterium]|nr:UDP-4-amino-4,6-dideoxy-N-acetyl-beta-L-altrosamine transaminase [Acidimicrobiales bacterium]